MDIANVVVLLLQDAALLFAVTFIHSQLLPLASRVPHWMFLVLQGVLFGVGGMVAMVSPVELSEGMLVDARLVMIAVAGAFAGPVSAVIAFALVIGYRVVLGGAGVPGAMAAATAVMLLGWGYYVLTNRKLIERNVITLMVLGVFTALLQLAALPFLPAGSVEVLMTRVIPPALLLYPVMTALQGILLAQGAEQLALRERVTQSESRYRQIVERVSDGIIRLDEKQRFTFVNTRFASMLGRQPEDILGHPVTDFFPEPSMRLWRPVNAASQTHDAEKSGLFETRMCSRSGDTIEMLVSLSPTREADSASGTLAVVTDVTALKKMQEQTHALQLATVSKRIEVLREFVQTISHDFRTPLAVINTNTYLLRKTRDLNQQYRRLDIISEQVAQIDRMLTDFTELARLEEDPEYAYHPVDINELVARVIHKSAPAAEARQHKLVYSPQSGIAPIIGEASTLERALKSLVDNAIDYTPDGGRIEVETASSNGHVVIRVRDNGIGISAADQPLIFEHFYRADASRPSGTGGVGVGLTIARKIVEAHKGQITVESRPGAGSTFSLQLPALEMEPHSYAG